jgi:RHS repeat-associated protein
VLQQTVDSNADRFIHGPRGIHAHQDNSGDWFSPMQDGLGSVRGVVDDVLAVQGMQHYEPYGTPFGAQGSLGMPFGFTGEQTDATELVYLRARYLSPEFGTFLSRDPFEGTAGRPMSLNGYMYVEGDPVDMVDPTGMCPPKSLCLQYAPQSWRCNCLEICVPAATCEELETSECTNTAAWNARCAMPRPEDSQDVNPCTTRYIFPVFGSCGVNCFPHLAGGNYNPDIGHRAVDIVPIGAFENYPESTYLAPDWSTRPGTEDYKTVYAVADGTIYKILDDGIVLRLSELWELVYVHIEPTVVSGFVSAGTSLGKIIPYYNATRTVDVSDQDHLHFGLRHPVRQTESLHPGPCLPRLRGG